MARCTEVRQDNSNTERHGRPFIATTTAKYEQVRAMFLKKTDKCKVLRNELSPAVRTEQRGNLSEVFLVFHDNSRLHTAAHIRETLLELIF